jgi:hypothetical protein
MDQRWSASRFTQNRLTMIMRISKEQRMEQLDRMTRNPEVMSGKACIRGMHFTVSRS